MTIYDISQEVFSCRVFPGDPAPERRVLSSMEKGGLYNLTAFNMFILSQKSTSKSRMTPRAIIWRG